MKKWLWIALILSLAVTSIGLYERTKAEWTYNTYEVAVPFKEVESLIRQGANEEDVFNGLKSSGVNALSIPPESIKSLENKGDILSLDQNEFTRFALLSGYPLDELPEKKGLYISILKSNFPVVESLENVFGDQVKNIEINERKFLYIEGEPKKIKNVYLGYSDDTFKLVESYGFSRILHVPVSDITEESKFIWEQAMTIDEHADQILFIGEEALGYPTNHVEWGNKLKEKGISTLSIEQFDQKGFENLARTNNLNVKRLISLDLGIGSLMVNQDKAIRAVKERNIRVLYIHINTDGDPEENLKENMKFFKSLNSSMPQLFKLGKPDEFSDLSRPFWMVAMALLGGITFVTLAVESLLKRKLAVVSGIAMSLIALGYLVFGSGLLLKLMALAVAIITPVYAALKLRPIERYRDILYQYGRAIFISFLGIWIGISLLYGTEFSLHIGEGFRGVKILYVFPIVYTILFAVYHLYNTKINLQEVKKLLALPILYGHLILLCILAGILVYYVGRTGNFGTVLSYELVFRQKLEELLYVRPRTKEFLIGFPFYILSLYFFMKNMKKTAYVCLIPAIIGWLSLVNTFTHLHIPIYVSVLRSLYSLSFGLIVGIVFIIAFKAGRKYYLKLRARW
ncbi:DUF5693 family protein [Alkalihalobacillus sp. TS-13]|uniref:DUF5693 family protein n=1 Tax=Alkalihalobacillus sp. TS-13 TaxID=2842455 RepID=UPI001C872E76|nr:DUF5693 family protein [Alkalihalobacillus sp. TS-13]